MAAPPTRPSAVYKLSSQANDYAALQLVDDYDLDRFDAFDGTPIAASWEPLRMFWETENGAFAPSDFSRVPGTGLIFSARALEALSDLLEGRGELLALEVADGSDYHLFNVTRVIDALDEERSELAYFSSGRVMDVDRYEFRPEELEGETLFKLAQFPRSRLYVTDAFVERAERAQLTGFDFGRLWDREASERV